MSELLDRFMAKVSPEPNSGCWLWTASINQGGYSRFWVSDHLEVGHRYAYRQFIGEVPPGLELDHLCRVRCCVNPGHLEPVTRRVNVMRGLLPQLVRERNLAKTHCRRGHPFTGSNLYIRPSGKRGCRACHREEVASAKKRKVA